LSTNLTSTLEPGDYIEKMYLSSGSCGNDSSIVQYGVWTAPSACFFDPIDGSYEMVKKKEKRWRDGIGLSSLQIIIDDLQLREL